MFGKAGNAGGAGGAKAVGGVGGDGGAGGAGGAGHHELLTPLMVQRVRSPAKAALVLAAEISTVIRTIEVVFMRVLLVWLADSLSVLANCGETVGRRYKSSR